MALCEAPPRLCDLCKVAGVTLLTVTLYNLPPLGQTQKGAAYCLPPSRGEHLTFNDKFVYRDLNLL